MECQGLAGPWYAQRERDAVGTRISGSMVREFRRGREPKLDRGREEAMDCKR